LGEDDILYLQWNILENSPMTYVKQTQRLAGFFRDLFRHESGGTITMIALSVGFLVAFVGLAVDTTRGYMLKQRLSYAMDTAALAAAKSATTTNVQTTGQLYFDANFPSGYMGVSNVSVNFALTNNDTEVTVTTSADMPTALMNVVGIKDFNLSLETIAQRQAKGLELVMALDTTGSMCSGGCWMDDLRDAANGLLDQLYGTADTVDNLFVGVAPFDIRLNLKNYPGLFNFTPVGTLDHVCVDRRGGESVATSDTPPSVLPFNNRTNTGVTNGGWPNSWNGPSGCLAEPALGLTESKSTLTNLINSLNAGGGTRVDIAAAWSFRMLSPDWRGLWGNATLPLDYDELLMEKAVILMTDGQNSSSTDDNTVNGIYTSAANDHLEAACDNMTDAGIIVYTVQFRTSGATMTNLLKNCATSLAHYYHADSDELGAVFSEIAAKLSNLRLIK
jgi:Flp pilus assembly protein TadG